MVQSGTSDGACLALVHPQEGGNQRERRKIGEGVSMVCKQGTSHIHLGMHGTLKARRAEQVPG